MQSVVEGWVAIGNKAEVVWWDVVGGFVGYLKVR